MLLCLFLSADPLFPGSYPGHHPQAKAALAAGSFSHTITVVDTKDNYNNNNNNNRVNNNNKKNNRKANNSKANDHNSPNNSFYDHHAILDRAGACLRRA